MDQFASQQQGSPAASASSLPAAAANSGSVDAVSSSSSAAAASAGSPYQADESSKTLYVGNLEQSISESYLQEIFSQAGGQPVESVKIIRDKNFSHQGGLNYGFVEFSDHSAAELALQQMNGRRIVAQELKVNWAFTGQLVGKEDPAISYNIFVGDLGTEITDETLSKAFGVFGNMAEARVMWDANSGKSRGYGFVSFKDRTDAERAIMSMNGQILGNRAIRCNWASQRGVPGPTFHPAGMHHGNSFKMVSNQAPPFNTTVYVGNLPPHTTQEDLIPFFQPFGMVVDIRLQADRGFAFVKLESHDKAANAIIRLNGTIINGRPAKLSWGKDRTAENAARGNHYNYYNNSGGYNMGGGHQNNGGYPYQYNNHNNHHSSNNNHYGQGYGRNGPHNHHYHHNNQHHGHHNNGHHMNNHNQHAFQHHQHQSLDAGSSSLSSGAPGLPPASMGVGSSGISQDAYDQFSYDNGGSR